MGDLDEIKSRIEIETRLKTYVRGVDRCQWELIRAAFFEDATDDHGDFSGTRDEFIAWLRERHVGARKSSHYLTNCLIEFAGKDVAAVETYFIAKLELAADAVGHRKMLLSNPDAQAMGTIHVEVLGRYLDRFERRNGEWRIAQRRVAFDGGQQSQGTSLSDAIGLMGSRNASDPLFAMRVAAGL